MLVNDQPVTLAAVRALARRLVEMHGQNEHVSLFARDAQLSLLDQFAGVSAELETVRALHARRRELEQELEGLSHNEQERLRTLDLLGFQVRELEQAKLQPGEDAHLEEERRILSNLEKIRAAASSAFEELYEDEGAAISRVAAAARQLDELRRYDCRHCRRKSNRWPRRGRRWRISPPSCATTWESWKRIPRAWKKSRTGWR